MSHFFGKACARPRHVPPSGKDPAWEEDRKRFWFRGFFILGLVQCAWWDDGTHLSAEIIPDDVERYGLHALYPIVRRIASVG
jgi:hypothetical protein